MPAKNGWIFLPTAADGVTIYSSDYTTVAYHPRLSVTYTVPGGACYAFTLSRAGNGAVPVASPTKSPDCDAGSYYAGAFVSLSGAAPDSGWQISGWTGTSNNASPASTNSLIMPVSTHAASVIYTKINHAPDAPVLMQPADNATGVSYPPTLQATVTDPETDAMSVTFYGGQVGAGSGADFTVVALPDTQFYSESYPATFKAQTQWIVDNRVAENIVYVAHEGDIVNVAGTAVTVDQRRCGHGSVGCRRHSLWRCARQP